MPVLVIYGMPHEVVEGALCQLISSLAKAVRAIPEIGGVSVFFPVDGLLLGLGEELVCFVEGLFVKPERTLEVRKRLTDVIYLELLTFAREYIPQCQRVEVFVKQFNPEKDGFASGDPNDNK